MVYLDSQHRLGLSTEAVLLVWREKKAPKELGRRPKPTPLLSLRREAQPLKHRGTDAWGTRETDASVHKSNAKGRTRVNKLLEPIKFCSSKDLMVTSELG